MGGPSHDSGRVLGLTGLIWLGGEWASHAIPPTMLQRISTLISETRVSVISYYNFSFVRYNEQVIVQLTLNAEFTSSASTTFLKEIHVLRFTRSQDVLVRRMTTNET